MRGAVSEERIACSYQLAATGSLTLALLVLGSFTANADGHLSFAITATEDVAILAHAFDGGADFHDRRGGGGAGLFGSIFEKRNVMRPF